MGTRVAKRTPYRSVAPRGGWAFGRLGNRRALNQKEKGLHDAATQERGMNIMSKTILITGANRGIGRARAEETLGRGAKRASCRPNISYLIQGGEITDVNRHGTIVNPPGDRIP